MAAACSFTLLLLFLLFLHGSLQQEALTDVVCTNTTRCLFDGDGEGIRFICTGDVDCVCGNAKECVCNGSSLCRCSHSSDDCRCGSDISVCYCYNTEHCKKKDEQTPWWYWVAGFSPFIVPTGFGLIALFVVMCYVAIRKLYDCTTGCYRSVRPRRRPPPPAPPAPPVPQWVVIVPNGGIALNGSGGLSPSFMSPYPVSPIPLQSSAPPPLNNESYYVHTKPTYSPYPPFNPSIYDVTPNCNKAVNKERDAENATIDQTNVAIDLTNDSGNVDSSTISNANENSSSTTDSNSNSSSENEA